MKKLRSLSTEQHVLELTYAVKIGNFDFAL